MRPFFKPTDTLVRAAERLRTGDTTSQSLVEQCLAAIDAREAEVRAWVLIDREGARRQAETCDAEMRAGNYRGPLHGIPIGIKDIIDVAGWPTAAGFEPWKGRIAPEDACVVRRLRGAGAVLLGKTVTTQFASFDPPVTRNPWNLERTPGGSSSGSAAAVACGMCYGALGSQTGGSITRPAAYCGVAGFKPTYQRIPEEGILPLAPSMDHPGPIALTVQDLALIFDVIGQWEINPQPSIGQIACLERPPRLGRLRGLFEELADDSVRASMDLAVDRLKRAGATVIETELPATFENVIRSHRLIMAVEAAAWHEVLFRQHCEEYQPRIRELLEEGFEARAIDYRRAKEHQAKLSHDMTGLLLEEPGEPREIDAMLAPATTCPAPLRDSTGNPAFNSPWSFTGLPVVSFPVVWTDEGLPLSVQMVGCSSADRDLFPIAHWCEGVSQMDA